MIKQDTKNNNLKFEIIFFATSIILALANFKYNSNYKYIMTILAMIFLAGKVGIYFLNNKAEKENNFKQIQTIQKVNKFINIVFVIFSALMLISILIEYFSNVDIKNKHQVTAMGITGVIIVLVVISILLAKKILIKYIYKQDISKTPEKYPVYLMLNIFIAAIILVILGILILLLLPYTGIKIFYWNSNLIK